MRGSGGGGFRCRRIRSSGSGTGCGGGGRFAGEAGHPLLGVRRELGTGEVAFETELSAGSPGWLADHRVFGRVLVPGAFYGVQAAVAALLGNDRAAAVRVEEVQIERPLALPEDEDGAGPLVQFVLGRDEGRAGRSWEVFSRGAEEERWIRHVTGRVGVGGPGEGAAGFDPQRLRASLRPVEVADFYRGMASAGIGYGPAFRGLVALWSGPAEALGEIALPAGLESADGGLHPVLLDSCLQTIGGVAASKDAERRVAGMPIGWERLWLRGPLPERLLCHARLADRGSAVGGDREASGAAESPEESGAPRVDLVICAPDGAPLGGVRGLALRQVTRAALQRAVDAVDDLLYEVDWREAGSGEAPGLIPADFVPDPVRLAADVAGAATRLAAGGMDPAELEELGGGLEEVARAYVLRALEALGWERRAGESVEPEPLRRRLGVVSEHARLLARMLALLEGGGLLAREATGSAWRVTAGAGERLPESFGAPEELADGLLARCPADGSRSGSSVGAAVRSPTCSRVGRTRWSSSSGESRAPRSSIGGPRSRRR